LPDGRPVHYPNLGKAFVKAANKAGLRPEGKRKLRFHHLRRTYARVLINAPNANLAYAAKQLGHSVEMFCSTYSGLLEEKGQAQGAMDASWPRGRWCVAHVTAPRDLALLRGCGARIRTLTT